MGSLHNDLHSWAAKARANGHTTIELDLETVDKIVLALLETVEDTTSEPMWVRCVDSLGSATYIKKAGATVSCVLSNGTAASLTFAVGSVSDVVALKLKIAKATTADEVIAIIQEAAGPTVKVEMV